ncbi:response regulator transcription factor [Pseudobacter ginsenosidimutans]|uniref:LuxR family two component transcriptional regulator n=1 Tax=Pseudobacter ginsenosidimutans TaxID=661488 RepID=A0A4Q7MW68_9BACT|nr:response regulator transcription factor [Pseudobacter ginsenosidimutans]RZS72289.1 LuxR family two component transcriptional regulator [Pseudobacter ginsenosidimutans]
MNSSSKTLTVALADDHVLVRSAISLLLSTIPHIQIGPEAGNGKELLDHLASGATPDIILLDINMPVMDGFETMKEIRKMHSAVKVVALTAYEDDLALLRLYKLGVKGYISKSIKKEELRMALETVADGNEYFPNLLKGVIQDDAAHDLLEKLRSLKERELTFLKYASMDIPYKEIAQRMNVSRYTIDDYRDSLYQKFSIQSRIGLILLALKFKPIIGGQ